jgi:hypothetical protein
MTFFLFNQHLYHVIVNDDARLIVGRVYPLPGSPGLFQVTSCIGPDDKRDEVATVNSLNDVIPTFIDHYGRNPVPWERDGVALYSKHTLFVDLRVEQDQQSNWLAYRDDYPMLQDTKPAYFATCADAQRAADAHELDMFPNARVVEDGLSWLPDPEIDWRSVPYLAEERLAWQRSSSDLIIWQSDSHATTAPSIWSPVAHLISAKVERAPK